MRLNRFIARSGVTSRRKAEELISSGRIKINGNVIKELATEVDPAVDKVEVDGDQIRLPQNTYLLFNKPKGYTVTKQDRHAQKTIFELLPDDPSLIAVGRLDKDSEGLLLITNDGDFAQNIIHPKNKIEKEYMVILEKDITPKDINKLISGLELEDGPAKAAKAEILGEKQTIIVINEGRKRQVRRMFEAIGNKVISLKRTRIGELKLDVKTGEYRELLPREIEPYA